ncbi:unnamed protein product [Camellia sinensis]
MQEEIIMQEEIVRVMNFHNWMADRNFGEIWETHEGSVVGLGSLFIELLNKIIKLLIDIHEHDGFNGDLWNNLRIRQIRRTAASRSWDVWGVDLVVNPPPKLSQIGGIILDVQYFRQMVHFAWVRFPLVLRPDAYDSFLKHYGFDPDHYFPIFFSMDRVHFIYKVYEIRKRNPIEFNRLVPLDQTNPIANMDDWLNRILTSNNQQYWPNDWSPLQHVLYFKNDQGQYVFRSYFEVPCEVVNYLRTVCEHGRDKNRNISSGKIVKVLHQVLPDALSKIHFALCTTFVENSNLTHLNASDIVKLMKQGPFGYKGLKLRIMAWSAVIS